MIFHRLPDLEQLWLMRNTTQRFIFTYNTADESPLSHERENNPLKKRTHTIITKIKIDRVIGPRIN